jgi:flagellar biosynthesis/type III secretory pathway chaperone
MERQVIELEKILKDEAVIFEKLYSLEERKTRAILEHNGRLLEKISREQEGLLAGVHSLESDRVKRTVDSRKSGNTRKGKVTLNDIAGSAGGQSGARLSAIGKKIGDIITRLSNLLETNRMLINDNMEYYNVLLTGLRAGNKVDAGYSPEGKEEETLKQSLLFNQTA